MLIDGFEDGDLSEYSGDTVEFTASTTNPFDGSYSLECSTTSSGSRTITRTDISWGPSNDSTLQYQLNRERHTTDLFFGVQSSTDVSYRTRVKDYETNDTIIQIAKSDGGFSVLSSTPLNIDKTAYDWLRIVVDWQSGGEITATVYDQTAIQLGVVSATDTAIGAGGIGVGVNSDDSTNDRTTYFDTIETVAIADADVTTHTAVSGSIDIRTVANGSFDVRNSFTGNTQMIEVQDATFVQGDTQYFDVSVVDANDNPVDLTDSSIEYTISDTETTVTKTLADSVTITDAVNGQFEVALSSSDTGQFRGGADHSAQVTDSTGDVATVFVGDVFAIAELQ